MNRYVIRGIAEDALRGKIVLLCEPGSITGREALRQVVIDIGLVDPLAVRRASWANGREELDVASGGRVILIRSPRALRGYAADVVYLGINAALGSQAPEWLESAQPCIDSTHGEIIRP